MTIDPLNFTGEAVFKAGIERVKHASAWALAELDKHKGKEYYQGLYNRFTKTDTPLFFAQDELIREIAIALIAIDRLKQHDLRGVHIVTEVLTNWLGILARSEEEINWEAVSFHRNFMTHNAELNYTLFPSNTMLLFKYLNTYSYPSDFVSAILTELDTNAERYFGDFAVDNQTDSLTNLVRMLGVCPFKQRLLEY